MLLNLYISIFIKLNKLNVIFMEKNLYFSFIFSIILKFFLIIDLQLQSVIWAL